MQIMTREAVPEDWPQLRRLLVDMGKADDGPGFADRFDACRRDPMWLVLVASDGDQLLGYAAAQDHGDHLRGGRAGRVARLHDVYVDPDVRRSGVGRVLVQAVVDWAAERASYLQWQAHETRSAPFYERLGFRGDPCPQPEYPEFEVAFPR